MYVFTLEINSAIDTINLQRRFCMKFTAHFKDALFLTLMQQNHYYLTIISAVCEKEKRC